MTQTFRGVDITKRLLEVDPDCKETYLIMKESAQEILKLRTQLSKATGLALRIENVLGQCLSKEHADIYYEGDCSIHKEFKKFLKEVNYE